MKKIYLLLALIMVVSGCGGCGGGGGGGDDVTCTIPCLEATPVVSINTIDSATGGNVDVSFIIKGDLTNVSNVSILLMAADIFSLTPPAGAGVVFNPTQANNTVTITVDAGTPSSTYYPHISITANSPVNSGNQYYIDPTKSQSNYTYVEVINGGGSTPSLSSYVVPLISVQ